VASVVTKPMEGAAAGGLFGFLEGAARGLSGAVVKPVAGALDFAAQTTAAQAPPSAIQTGGIRLIPLVSHGLAFMGIRFCPGQDDTR